MCCVDYHFNCTKPESFHHLAAHDVPHSDWALEDFVLHEQDVQQRTCIIAWSILRVRTRTRRIRIIGIGPEMHAFFPVTGASAHLYDIPCPELICTIFHVPQMHSKKALMQKEHTFSMCGCLLDRRYRALLLQALLNLLRGGCPSLALTETAVGRAADARDARLRPLLMLSMLFGRVSGCVKQPGH